MRPHAEDGLADTLFLLRGPAVWVADVLHWAAPVLTAFGVVLLIAVIPLSLARRTLGRWLLKGHIALSFIVPAFASIVLVIGLMNVALVVAVGVALIVAVVVAIFGWLEGL
jgi:hypothetical protein